jgi:signal transduction histidine kinase/CheY-like chemotaxis protein/PAS domain-containing protein
MRSGGAGADPSRLRSDMAAGKRSGSGANGAPSRIERDLLEAKAALEGKTEELAHTVSTLRATLDATADGILVTDGAQRVTGCNRRYLEMWHVPEALAAAGDGVALRRQCHRHLVDPAGFERRVEAIESAHEHDTLDTIELRDGRVLERHSRLLYVGAQRIGRVWSFRDVTERRATERRLVEETRLLELLNRSAADLAGELDVERLLQNVTDVATALSGARFGAFFANVADVDGDSYRLVTLSGSSRDAFESEGRPRATALFGPTFGGEPPIRVDDLLADPRCGTIAPALGVAGGHPTVRSFLAVPVVSRSGEVIGGLVFGHPEVGVFSERSERLVVGIAAHAAVAVDNARLYERAQDAAREREVLLDAERAARTSAERLSSLKDDFLATLSHELRTPLSAILGWSQVLRLKSASASDLDEGLRTIERNARIQVQLVEDLLDMSRITSGKLRLDLQPVAAETFVENAIATVRPAAEAKGVRVETVLDPGAGTVLGDVHRLQQVVWNLLANAIKFTPSGGKVEVRLARVGSQVEISVADTGVGIASEFLPHVFERFRQADASASRAFGGLGLGLSIVRHLTEMHGGTVRATSPGVDRGSTFVVALPLAVAHLPAQRAARAHAAPAGAGVADFRLADLAGVSVLVVDDEPDARELVRRVLSECGASVHLASDAAAAMVLVQRERPDTLVSDIGMPGTDGYQLLRKLRELGAERGGALPAIALTAFARSEDRTRALRAGFLAHVAKPVEPAELVATVASVVGRIAPSN